MILYIENPTRKDATTEVLKIINKFSKVEGYKINTQKSAAFLHTNSERSKRGIKKQSHFQFSSVQSLSCVPLFVTTWTAARQASLSITNSQSLLKLMYIESVMPHNHLILCHPLLPPSIFPSIRVIQMSQFFASGGQSIGVSASTSVLSMNIQD